MTNDHGTNGRALLELKLTEQVLTNGVIQLSWCINREVLEQLKRLNKLPEVECNPHLLISVIPMRYTDTDNIKLIERRYLFKLTDLMAFIEVNQPGETIIFGTIIWGYKEPHKIYLQRIYGDYDTDLFNLVEQDIELIEGRFNNHAFKIGEDTKIAKARLDIEVPEEAFAKEPPEWERRWVELWFWYKSRDRCQYRRRRMFAYSIQLIAFIPLMLTRWVWMLLLVLCGFWRLNPGPLFNPIQRIGMIWQEGESRYWMVPGWKTRFRYIFVPFTPIILLLISGFISLYWVISRDVWFAILFGGLFTGFLIGMIFTFTFYNEEIFNFLKPRKKEDLKEDLGDVICGTEYKRVRDLPRNKRTIKLRYQELKANWCKPFSG